MDNNWDETFLVTERSDWTKVCGNDHLQDTDIFYQQENNEKCRLWEQFCKDKDQEAENKSLQKWNDFLKEKYK